MVKSGIQPWVQVGDQKLEKGNLALARNVASKRSVRVIRKGTEKNQYIYEGEYCVVGRCTSNAVDP